MDTQLISTYKQQYLCKL